MLDGLSTCIVSPPLPSEVLGIGAGVGVAEGRDDADTVVLDDTEVSGATALDDADPTVLDGLTACVVSPPA